MLSSCHELGAKIGSLDRGRKSRRDRNIWCQERASQLLLESEKHEVHGRRHSSSFAHESCRVYQHKICGPISPQCPLSKRTGGYNSLDCVCPYVYRFGGRFAEDPGSGCGVNRRFSSAQLLSPPS
jgi:hypothetical protein